MALVQCSSVTCGVSCGPGGTLVEVSGDYHTETQSFNLTGTEGQNGSCCQSAAFNYVQANCVAGGGLGGVVGPKPDFGLGLEGGGGKQVQGRRPLQGGGRRPARTGGMTFRGADGKLLEGKQEILGVELPKVLVVAGVAVAAYFIVKKMK